MKFGGSIRIDSIDSFSSFARSTFFGFCPMSFSPRDNLIPATASYATLFCKRISSSPANSSSNFSSVNLFLNFPKKPFSSIGASIVSSKDCSNSFVCFGFSFLVGVFLIVFTTISSSFFLLTQFFSFSFSLPNMFFRGRFLL